MLTSQKITPHGKHAHSPEEVMFAQGSHPLFRLPSSSSVDTGLWFTLVNRIVHLRVYLDRVSLMSVQTFWLKSLHICSSVSLSFFFRGMNSYPVSSVKAKGRGDKLIISGCDDSRS